MNNKFLAFLLGFCLQLFTLDFSGFGLGFDLMNGFA